MIPDDLAFDSVHILPEDYDDIEDGEIELAGIRLSDLSESAEGFDHAGS